MQGDDAIGSVAGGGDLGDADVPAGERTVGVEPEPAHDVGLQHPSVGVARQAQLRHPGRGPVVAVLLVGDRAPVGQPGDDATRRHVEVHVEHRRPPGAERPGPIGATRVPRAGDVQRRGDRREVDVVLAMDHVAVRGVDRVVDVARRERWRHVHRRLVDLDGRRRGVEADLLQGGVDGRTVVGDRPAVALVGGDHRVVDDLDEVLGVLHAGEHRHEVGEHGHAHRTAGQAFSTAA